MIREGVLPAVTTPCTSELRVEHGFLVVHLERLLRGRAGFRETGSPGRGDTLELIRGSLAVRRRLT
jgi:hypothetical protein